MPVHARMRIATRSPSPRVLLATGGACRASHAAPQGGTSTCRSSSTRSDCTGSRRCPTTSPRGGVCPLSSTCGGSCARDGTATRC
eukprot:3420975-Prymnesium_polylepis.1